MFTAFISKSFVNSLMSEENIKNSLFVSFISDFFQKLNIDYIVCDYDMTINNNDFFHQLTIGALYQYCGANVIRTTKPIEYYLTNEFSAIYEIPYSDMVKPYLFEKALFFVDLLPEMINLNPGNKDINIVSTLDFTSTYSNFLINGKLNNIISQEEFLKGKTSFNPFDCPKSKVLMIDDQYLIKKSKDGKIIESELEKRLNKILPKFIANTEGRTKTIILLIPSINPIDRTPWSQIERSIISKTIKKVVVSNCIEADCQIIYHDLNSHSRRALTNMHLFSLSDGFDFQIKRADKVRERVDDIKYESVFVKSSARLLSYYIENRLQTLDAKKYFPIFIEKVV